MMIQAATAPTWSASTAGRNWMVAIHDSQAWSAPVKSRKSSVSSPKKRMARVSLIFLSILFA